jgi:type IV pilus assembly protein PilA
VGENSKNYEKTGDLFKMLNKLQKFRQDLKKKGKGFTLVELIVVIIIIAIIAAVAIPAITSFQDNARKSRIQSEHRELVSAIQSYIGAQDDPTNPGEITLAKLAPYMSKNAKNQDGIVNSLAKDKSGDSSTSAPGSAHQIDSGNHKLISTFTPSNGGQATVLTYDWSAKGVNSN